MKYIQPINPAPIRHLLDKHHDDAPQYANSVLKNLRSDINVETYWFPTLQNPDNPSNHIPIQKRNLTESYALEELERLDPQANQKSRDLFSTNFEWMDSTLIY